jgi:transcriptional regulator with XRE-family HTH domain
MRSTYERSSEFVTAKRKVLARSKYLCEDCGKDAEAVHHIDLSKDNHSLDNLIALCRKCHGKAHTREFMKNTVIDINKLTEIVKSKGMTKIKLSKELGISAQSVGIIFKTGRAKPTILKKLLEVLNCTKEEIFTEEAIKNNFEIKIPKKYIDMITIRMPESMYRKLRLISFNTNVPMTKIITKLLEDFVEDTNRKNIQAN